MQLGDFWVLAVVGFWALVFVVMFSLVWWSARGRDDEETVCELPDASSGAATHTQS